MLFKKKKKQVEEVVEPNAPKSEADDKNEEVSLISETPIADDASSNNMEEEILTNQNVGEEDKSLDDFNEIHHESLAKEEEKIDYRNMSADELIQDINVDEYCPNCGSKVNLDADICFVCGTELEK